MILDGKAVSKKILDNLKVKVGNLSKPVSYTHLTLPTIA